jgi:electron transport complex protein RnfD
MVKLNVNISPHVRDSITTQNIMLDVVIAMIPMCAFGIWHFGIRTLLVIFVSVLSAVISEAIFQKLLGKKLLISDFSATVTGMLIALNVPVTIPMWMLIVGNIFAIVIVKGLYGGLGQNFMNPALAARCFMTISFTKAMTTWTLDSVAMATPLATAREMLLEQNNMVSVNKEYFNLAACFTGKIPGTIGEVSAVAILVGAIYLLAKKIINLRIPGVYIASFVVVMILFSPERNSFNYIVGHVLSGGLLLAAFFMATDYVTSPKSPLGQIIYAAFIGIMNAIFRLYGASVEGASYSILLGNIITPLIDKYIIPTPFGMEKSLKRQP